MNLFILYIFENKDKIDKSEISNNYFLNLKMKNHDNFNNKKSKGKPKQTVKQRGYYYSSANINKRQEIKKQLNDQNNNFDNNNMEEDFFSKQKNNNINNKRNNFNSSNNNNISIGLTQKNKNNLELYDKNIRLLNYIESERKDFNFVLNKLKLLNYSIGNLILKPKIKNYEINKKIIREKEKKEQEEINFNKNISDKIDEALNKANLALDNLKYIGRQKYQKQQNNNLDNNSNDINMNSGNNINTKYNYNEFKKEKEKMNLFNLAQKCLDKYEDNLQINTNNHDEYFITVSKTRKLFKDAKEQLQSAKYRLRNAGLFFDELYQNKKNNINKNYKEEPITLVHLNKEIFFKENNFIRINSFLKSEIFKKLFIKVLYNENFIENPNISNDINNKNSIIFNNTDIYNIFSLWYMIKEINLLIKQINENNNTNFFFINKNIHETFLGDIKRDDVQKNTFLNHYIFELIEKYLAFLNRKNNNSNNTNENQIFTKDYYKLYEIFFKLEQSKIAKYIIENIENNISQQNNIISKEELNYYKNIQSIFTNKGKYICSIINK